MGSIQVYYSGCRGGVGWVGWTWSYENSPLPSVIRRPVPKAMMVTSHCSNQGRGRFSRRPQNFVTLDSPCGVLSDSEDDAGEEAPYTTTTVDRLQCGVRGHRWGRCAAVDECADVKGRSTKAAVPWRSLFCGGDRKWGVFRCTTLGAGVGLAG